MKKEFGEPLFFPFYKGRIQPDYNQPLFIQAISNCRRLLNRPDSEILLDSRNRVGVLRLPLQKNKKVPVVIKEFRSVGVNRLKSTLFSTKAYRAWERAHSLLERGVKTPAPVAYLEEKRGFFSNHCFFLTERISGIEEIRFLFPKLTPSKPSELLGSLARYLSLCHKKGILHGDLSDGNILVKKDEAGRFVFYLIDTNRIKIKRQISLFKGVKNLVRLGIPSSLQPFFLGQYLGMPHVKRWLWWYKANKAAYSHYIELKKKLRVRKLVQKLKIQ